MEGACALGAVIVCGVVPVTLFLYGESSHVPSRMQLFLEVYTLDTPVDVDSHPSRLQYPNSTSAALYLTALSSTKQCHTVLVKNKS